jgi:hypothetical protein
MEAMFKGCPFKFLALVALVCPIFNHQVQLRILESPGGRTRRDAKALPQPVGKWGEES